MPWFYGPLWGVTCLLLGGAVHVILAWLLRTRFQAEGVTPLNLILFSYRRAHPRTGLEMAVVHGLELVRWLSFILGLAGLVALLRPLLPG